MSKRQQSTIAIEVTLAAVLFGMWQESWLAGAFMLMVLMLQVDLAEVRP